MQKNKDWERHEKYTRENKKWEKKRRSRRRQIRRTTKIRNNRTKTRRAKAKHCAHTSDGPSAGKPLKKSGLNDVQKIVLRQVHRHSADGLNDVQFFTASERFAPETVWGKQNGYFLKSTGALPVDLPMSRFLYVLKFTFFQGTTPGRALPYVHRHGATGLADAFGLQTPDLWEGTSLSPPAQCRCTCRCPRASDAGPLGWDFLKSTGTVTLIIQPKIIHDTRYDGENYYVSGWSTKVVY